MLALHGDWPLWLAGIIATTIIVLLIIFAWIGRDRTTRHLRVGFFLERERFSAEEPEQQQQPADAEQRQPDE